jgi:hypothetical protein
MYSNYILRHVLTAPVQPLLAAWCRLRIRTQKTSSPPLSFLISCPQLLWFLLPLLSSKPRAHLLLVAALHFLFQLRLQLLHQQQHSRTLLSVQRRQPPRLYKSLGRPDTLITVFIQHSRPSLSWFGIRPTLRWILISGPAPITTKYLSHLLP